MRKNRNPTRRAYGSDNVIPLSGGMKTIREALERKPFPVDVEKKPAPEPKSEPNAEVRLVKCDLPPTIDLRRDRGAFSDDF